MRASAGRPFAQYVINNAGIAEWNKLEDVTDESMLRRGCSFRRRCLPRLLSSACCLTYHRS